MADNVYLNGEILDREQARISPSDRGFLHGNGFFETLRIGPKGLFRLGAHLDRLSEACRCCGWEWVPSADRIGDAVGHLIRDNRVELGYLRITVSAGPSEGSLDDLTVREPTVYIDAHAMELPPLDKAPPLALCRAEHRINETSPLVNHKATAYHENVLALARGRARGADEVYFLNFRDELTEGAFTNLFFVSNGVVRTPEEACGLLPGITREALLEICGQEDVPVEVGRFKENALRAADEIFCTNSLRGVVPVEQVMGQAQKLPAPGPLTRRLQENYGRLVGRESHL